MNRTVKVAPLLGATEEATIKAFHSPDLDSLKAHVLAFVSAYNFAKHLKALRWRTPFETTRHAWTSTPDIFKLNPRHLIPAPNIATSTPTGGKAQSRAERLLVGMVHVCSTIARVDAIPN